MFTHTLLLLLLPLTWTSTLLSTLAAALPAPPLQAGIINANSNGNTISRPIPATANSAGIHPIRTRLKPKTPLSKPRRLYLIRDQPNYQTLSFEETPPNPSSSSSSSNAGLTRWPWDGMFIAGSTPAPGHSAAQTERALYISFDGRALESPQAREMVLHIEEVPNTEEAKAQIITAGINRTEPIPSSPPPTSTSAYDRAIYDGFVTAARNRWWFDPLSGQGALAAMWAGVRTLALTDAGAGAQHITPSEFLERVAREYATVSRVPSDNADTNLNLFNYRRYGDLAERDAVAMFGRDALVKMHNLVYYWRDWVDFSRRGSSPAAGDNAEDGDAIPPAAGTVRGQRKTVYVWKLQGYHTPVFMQDLSGTWDYSGSSPTFNKGLMGPPGVVEKVIESLKGKVVTSNILPGLPPSLQRPQRPPQRAADPEPDDAGGGNSDGDDSAGSGSGSKDWPMDGLAS
ncbi:MAG: hypothetical protein M1825_004337 [Sarcosagium campestre]|nr:MAG: hypothetical protein M1825_004337 [Sarcosagium campestre]